MTATAGAPLFDTPDGVGSLGSPTATLPLDTLVATDEKAAWNAPDGSPILRVHTGDISGWTAGSNLRPRDSLAPRVWDTDTGVGVFSPNGDGRQDSIDITATLSESASWKLRVVHGDTTLASRSGTGDTPSMTWAPAAGSVDDGTYTWELEATDALGNGPMAWDGEIDVDTQAPDVTLADAEAATVPWFAPNGDGTRDTVGFAVGSTEPGTIIGSATNESDDVVDTFSASVTSSTTVTWDGRNADGYVADGRYTVTVRARDRAGNQSGAQTRTVDVYGSLGYVASSKTVFYPQDGDSMSRSTVLTFKLASPATVSWRILDAAGQTVRTIRTDASLDAGTQSFGWDGRNDAGAFVARGTYRSYVAATNGTQSAAQAVAVVADAFKIVTSDTTPGRGQRLTVTATAAETLDTVPRLGVYQPGISAWTASMTKVSTGVYRVTITLKSSSSGTLRLKVSATDSGGRSQSSNVYLPLH